MDKGERVYRGQKRGDQSWRGKKWKKGEIENEGEKKIRRRKGDENEKKKSAVGRKEEKKKKTRRQRTSGRVRGVSPSVHLSYI